MNKTLITIGALLLLGGVLVGSFIYTYRTRPTVPMFSYDSQAVDGWWGSDNINVRSLAGDNYRGAQPREKLPVADLTVHHGSEGGTDVPEDNCFVLFSYFDYPLTDTDAAYKEYADRKQEKGELTELPAIGRTLKTYEGNKELALQRYDYSEENEGALSGYQIGFAQLEDGHVRVEGVCKTAEDLELTLPVLDAVELREN